ACTDDKTQAPAAIEICNRVGGRGLQNGPKCQSRHNECGQNSDHIRIPPIPVAPRTSDRLQRIVQNHLLNNTAIMEDGASRKDAMTLQRPVVVMKLQGLAVVAALFVGLSIPDSRAASELEGLFKGRTISFVVGYGPGTGNDLWMRVVQ